jgi:hypothetical protein
LKGLHKTVGQHSESWCNKSVEAPDVDSNMRQPLESYPKMFLGCENGGFHFHFTFLNLRSTTKFAKGDMFKTVTIMIDEFNLLLLILIEYSMDSPSLGMLSTAYMNGEALKTNCRSSNSLL